MDCKWINAWPRQKKRERLALRDQAELYYNVGGKWKTKKGRKRVGVRYRAGIFKFLWSPGIDSSESIPPAYVAWRAGTTTLFLGS
jgi:hypothetical protein